MMVSEVIRQARANVASAAMESSARLCLSDAVSLYDAGNFADAKVRALKSLAYSVGVFSPIYVKAAQ